MENIVNFHGRRQLQRISQGSNRMGDPKRTNPLGQKLVLAMFEGNVLGGQKDFLTRVQDEILPAVIIVQFLALLGSFQSQLSLGQGRLPGRRKILGSRTGTEIKCRSHGTAWMSAMIKKEWSILHRLMPSIIDGKFSCRQKHVPIGLDRVDIMPEHVIKDPIDSLSLTIRLRMESSGRTVLNAMEAETLLKKGAHELGITISDERNRPAMLRQNRVVKQMSYLKTSDSGVCGDKMDHLGEFINKHTNRIITSRCQRKSHNEIHGDSVPWQSRRDDRLHQTRRLVVRGLVPLTGDTSIDKCCDIFEHIRPPKEPLQMMQGLGDAKMTSSWRIMHIRNAGLADRCQSRDNQERTFEPEPIMKTKGGSKGCGLEKGILLIGCKNGRLESRHRNGGRRGPLAASKNHKTGNTRGKDSAEGISNIDAARTILPGIMKTLQEL